MLVTYPATYRDRLGEERTSIRNDGTTLFLTIRGVEFQGRDFDLLEPAVDTDPSKLSSFSLDQDCLCSCVIDTEIPLPVVTPEGTTGSVLEVHLELGDPRPSPRGGIDRENLTLGLSLGDRVLTSRGSHGDFEGQLVDLQKQMPEGTYLKSCINCAFSDYSPGGHGLFGGLACFRDNKAGYQAVRSKGDMFRVWGTMTEFVQETHFCPEFERRAPRTGYRG